MALTTAGRRAAIGMGAAGLMILGLPWASAAPVAATVPGPQLSASQTSVNFGNVPLGTFSNPVTVTLTNTGGAADVLTGDTYGGADPNDFVALPLPNPVDGNTCTIDPSGNVTIPVGGTCDLTMGFFPGAPGARSATITLTDNSTSPPVFAVQGNGTEGYYTVTGQGAVSDFGNAGGFGDTSGSALKAPIAGIEQTGDDQGYWLVGSDGGIFAYGDAQYFGSTGSLVLNKAIVGMAATPDDGGYWLVASDGGIFAFGDAPFFGSTGGMRLNKPIVGMAPTLDGGGYWLVASDGGIFTFGDAPYFGSTGAIVLNKPIVGMATTPDGGGYWLVASDGGIFTFGNAQFYGSTGALTLNKPIVGMAPTPDGRGYWLVASDGGIFAFGDAQFSGSTGGTGVTDAVGMADSGSPTLQALLDQPASRHRLDAMWRAHLARRAVS